MILISKVRQVTKCVNFGEFQELLSEDKGLEAIQILIYLPNRGHSFRRSLVCIAQTLMSWKTKKIAQILKIIENRFLVVTLKILFNQSVFIQLNLNASTFELQYTSNFASIFSVVVLCSIYA